MGRVECVTCQVPERKVRGGGVKGGRGVEVDEGVRVVGGRIRGVGEGIEVDGGAGGWKG